MPKKTNAINVTLHTLNGDPLPESAARGLETAAEEIAKRSKSRLIVQAVRS